jgi:hypothetical protein
LKFKLGDGAQAAFYHLQTHVCCVAPAAGILICVVRDILPKRAAKWVPSPMAMSIPFYIGAASVGNRGCFDALI